MEDSPIVKDSDSRTKISGPTIKRDLDLNGLSLDVIYGRTL